MSTWETYPTPGSDEFAELYTDRDDLLTAVNRVIMNTLPTRTDGGYEVIEFTTIESPDTILAAITEAPRPALTLFLAVTGLSESDLKDKAEVGSVYGIENSGAALPHKDPRAQQVAPVILSHLTTDLLKETVLQQTTHRWTLDHRRHYRKEFEADVLTRLEHSGIPLRPDSQVSGAPDIAVPVDDETMAVIGEIRRTNKQDTGNRIDEFKSEIREHTDEHPNAKHVVVLTIAEEVTPEKRASHITELQESVGHLLDGVYTQQTLDELVVDLRRWTPQLQTPLAKFTTATDSPDDSTKSTHPSATAHDTDNRNNTEDPAETTPRHTGDDPA